MAKILKPLPKTVVGLCYRIVSIQWVRRVVSIQCVRETIFLNVPKSVQKSWHILEGYFPTCKPSRYTKQNLRLLTITTSKGFGIGPSSTEIGGG